MQSALRQQQEIAEITERAARVPALRGLDPSRWSEVLRVGRRDGSTIRSLSGSSITETLHRARRPALDSVGVTSALGAFQQRDYLAVPSTVRIFQQMDERQAMFDQLFGPYEAEPELRTRVQPLEAVVVERDVLAEVRDEVTEHLARRSPLALQRLDGAHAAILREDAESLAQAATSCRRALEAVADAVWPPSSDLELDRQGRELKVGRQEYRNRLVLFFERRVLSKSRRRADIEELDALLARLSWLVRSSSKGVHDDLDLGEVRRIYLTTVQVVAEIARHDRY